MNQMQALRAQDFRQAIGLLSTLSGATADVVGFARAGVAELSRVVASEITTLSICDPLRNTRSVVGDPREAISAADRRCFDHYFHSHPLVRYHLDHPQGGAWRISDSLSARVFRASGLYHDYYRSIGIDHALAVPLFVDRGLLVSFVFNRRGRDFSDRECALLDLVRGPLSAFYRNAQSQERTTGGFATLPVTPRERAVLTWLAAGKTDRQIAAILGANLRTVQKHLQHIYEKLGVETRTAAVMRAMELSLRRPFARPDLPASQGPVV